MEIETPSGSFQQCIDYEEQPRFCQHCMRFNHEEEECWNKKEQQNTEPEFRKTPRRRRRNRGGRGQARAPRQDLVAREGIEPAAVTITTEVPNPVKPATEPSTDGVVNLLLLLLQRYQKTVKPATELQPDSTDGVVNTQRTESPVKIRKELMNENGLNTANKFVCLPDGETMSNYGLAGDPGGTHNRP